MVSGESAVECESAPVVVKSVPAENANDAVVEYLHVAFSLVVAESVVCVVPAARFTVGAIIVTDGGVVSTGAVIVTLADCVADPPVPVHCKVYVWLVERFVKDCVPLVALVPFQAPLAVQVVALVEDQVMVEPLPLVTDVGDAEIVTVGTGARVVMLTLFEASERFAAASIAFTV